MTQILWVTVSPTQPRKQSWAWGPALEQLQHTSLSQPAPLPRSDDARALGSARTWVPLCLEAGPNWAHSQHHPAALGTLPFNKGRLQPRQLFWQQNYFFSLKPCHHLDLERHFFPFTSFLFPIFMWRSPPLPPTLCFSAGDCSGEIEWTRWWNNISLFLS